MELTILEKQTFKNSVHFLLDSGASPNTTTADVDDEVFSSKAMEQDLRECACDSIAKSDFSAFIGL